MDAEEKVDYIVHNQAVQYANPLYYQPTQSAYAPQPGTMYYQPDPPNVFGEPISEEEAEEEV